MTWKANGNSWKGMMWQDTVLGNEVKKSHVFCLKAYPWRNRQFSHSKLRSEGLIRRGRGFGYRLVIKSGTNHLDGIESLLKRYYRTMGKTKK